MLQLSSMYSFQVSTLASMRESTLMLSVNWNLKEPQKLNTPHGQTVTRVFTLPMIKRTLSFHKVNFYRPQRSCGRGYVLTGVCHSVNGWGVSASVHAGIPHPSPLGADSPRKQNPAYTQWVAGKHPTGMHSCNKYLYSNKSFRATHWFFCNEALKWLVLNYIHTNVWNGLK